MAAGARNNEAASRVLIVDDHPLVSHGVARLIEHEEGLAVCGRAATVAEATALFEAERPDLVVLDILLPNGNGWDLLERFVASDVPTEILVFSSLDPELYAGKALAMGAAGYVHKSMVIDEIVPAIRAALDI